MRKLLLGILVTALFAAVFSLPSRAQFRTEAFSQNYQNPGDTIQVDTTDRMFSFAEYFGGVRHKRDARIGVLFAGSMIFPGGQQMYNRQYWKLPVIYGGIGAGLGLGFYYKSQYNKSVAAYDAAYALDPETTVTIDSRLKTISTLSFVGAGLVYWGMLMDGTINYKKGDPTQHPGRATIYSLLLPGLGQIYNQEYWKIPIYWGGLAACYNYYRLNRTNYERYRWIYNAATDEDTVYDGPISAEAALYYRNLFRRYRDWSTVAMIIVYLLNVIDADVFSYMMDFQVTDDLALKVEPSFTLPQNQYAFQPASVGLGLKLKF